tara:strand:+ start:119 stop:727 length:609 start_codon:yes stop_codon:yes gene_type:complete
MENKVDLIQMFSVPLYKFSVPNWEEEKKDILKALPKEKRVKEYEDDIYTDFFDNSRSRKLPSYADLVLDVLSPCMEEFIQIQSSPGWLGVDAMWYQTEYRGQKHMLHNHGNIGWSSVFYINFDPKIHTSTKFLSPFNSGSGIGNILQWYQPDVKEGDFIIFNSDIPHEALPNESDKKRTIISMNFQTQQLSPVKQYQLNNIL